MPDSRKVKAITLSVEMNWKKLTDNVRYSLGKRTLLIDVKDDEGNFVNSKLFQIAKVNGKLVIQEQRSGYIDMSVEKGIIAEK